VRIIVVVLVLVAVFVSPLLVFGATFDDAWNADRAVARLQSYGAWAWAVGGGLIVADLVLPVPATVIMTALGMIYGPFVGGLVGAAASALAGAIAFALARLIGHRAAVFLVGERDLERLHLYFQRAGGWAIVLTRPMPLVAEVVACLAGLSQMSLRVFIAALICGTLPSGFVFAALGARGAAGSTGALVMSALIPLALWPVARWMLRRGSAGPAPEQVVSQTEVQE